MANVTLKKAKKNKNDEFYTQLSDIEQELKHYKNYFKGKTIFCNCDDPEWSNFWKYFELNFTHFGLKKLVSTHYELDKPSYKLEIVGDITGDGKVDNKDIIRTPLKQNGDFRSPEAVAIMKEADIIVTNPPFSLFREYLEQLESFNKDFIIIGNKNALTYKEVFKLIKENKMWLGYRNINKDMWLILPDNAEKWEKINEDGKKLKHIMACWFTNLDINKRHEDLIMYKQYNESEYPSYENYDAINIDKVTDIPLNYDGIIGVPITYLDKYNPKQFEIIELGIVGSCTFTNNRKMEILDKNGLSTGKFTYNAKGTLYKKYNPMLDKKPAFKDVETGELYSSIYARVLIRKRSS